MAARYFINGGVNSNWSTSGNWSATDGGVASGVKPSASDDVHFTTNSPSCIIDTVGVALSIDFTGWGSKNLTMTAGLSVSGNFTMVSTMTILGTSNLVINASATLTSNTKTWPNALILSSGNLTYTLADNWTVTGLFTCSAGAGVIINLNGFIVNCNGGYTFGGGGTVTGTTTITFPTGGVTYTGGGGTLQNNLTFSHSSGVITLVSFVYNTGTITNSSTGSATFITTGTLTLSDFASLNTGNLPWNNITINKATGCTITLNSLLIINGVLNIAPGTGTTITFTGAFGWISNTLTIPSAGRNIILASGVTYIITSSTTITGTAATHNNISSSSGTIKAILVLNYGAVQDIDFCDAIRIDSSGGQTIRPFKGVLTTTTNWQLLTAPSSVAYTFVN